jgi:hypothetical protein
MNALQLSLNQLVLGSSPSRGTNPQPIHYQWVPAEKSAQVDTISSVMEDDGDKMATTHEAPTSAGLNPPAPKRGKHGKPAAVASFERLDTVQTTGDGFLSDSGRREWAGPPTGASRPYGFRR